MNRRGLARRLITYLVLFSSFITIFTTAGQLYWDYLSDVEAVQGAFDLIEGGYIQSIEAAVWTADRDALQLLVNGIIEIRDISFAQVTVRDMDLVVESGVALTSDALSRTYGLHWTYRDQLLDIGSLTVGADLQAIVARLIDKVWIVLLSNGVKTGLVVLFVYAIFRRLITRHLEKLASTVSTLSPEGLTEPFEFDRVRSDPDMPDELDMVADALNQMRGNLTIAYERLTKTLDIAPEAIIHTDEAGRILGFNRGAERVFGYTAGQIVGRNVDVLIAPRYRDRHAAHLATFGAAQEDYRHSMGRSTLTGLKADGTEFPAEGSISKFEISGRWNFIAIISDITERVGFINQIVRAKEEAEVADRAKSEFLAAASHELRTPLNAIIGFSELIESEVLGPVGNDRYRDYIHDIHRAAASLLELIESLLEVSALESAEEPEGVEPIDVNGAIADAVTLLKQEAARHDVTIRVEPAPGRIEVLIRQTAFYQIIWNLVTNGIKYNRPGGTVTVTATRNGDVAEIRVQDDGIGIPADRLGNITEPFTRIHEDSYIAREGWGLGLAIVKKLVESFDGDLNIESAEGKGTLVTVRLRANCEKTGRDGAGEA